MAEFDYEVVNGRKIRVRPQEVVSEIDENGYFVRQPNHFTEGFGEGKNPVEKGRYHLVWAKLCHWSNRASIVRELLGLEDAISVNMVDHAKHEKNLGWEFVYDKEHIDPVLGIQFLSEAYYKADDDYTGRTTVPALIDTKTGKVVNNDYTWLTNYFEVDFKPFHKKGAPDLYPEELRKDIDEMNEWLFDNINNGVYKATFGGIIVDSGKFDWKASGKYPAIADANPSYHGVSFVDAAGPAAFVTYIRAILLRDMGATISPFNAFLLLQGTETLSLRIDRHVENTKKVVEYLSNHPMVEHVNHPSLPNHPDHALYEKYFPNGGASIFTFEIKGGQEEAHKFIDNLKIFSLLANVADVKSLVIHPATTTHSQLTEEELLDQGIKPNTIRLSIGTEHIDDIIADLEGGFAAVQGK